ncbi:MAG: hypothetical protein QOG44_2710 [Acidimicrobiaceae bacterium]|nr:hypothetical protein [Acidimicrobiaceae bacterium]MDQ1443435.1 hypothetical protein [Acidimicrobiaceae bacterium]
MRPTGVQALDEFLFGFVSGDSSGDIGIAAGNGAFFTSGWTVTGTARATASTGSALVGCQRPHEVGEEGQLS